ncbi:hypothetical protein [Aureimonas sp. SA4125]|nr:hypothetical protein [Aureimonas sp. SA4125]
MSTNESNPRSSDSFVGRLWNKIVEARTRQAEQQFRHYNRHRR